MLHDLGACDRAILVHMTHDEHGDLLLFSYRQQPRGTLLHLTDCTGRGRDIHAAHGLDGVNDHKVWLFFFD